MRVSDTAVGAEEGGEQGPHSLWSVLPAAMHTVAREASEQRLRPSVHQRALAPPGNSTRIRVHPELNSWPRKCMKINTDITAPCELPHTYLGNVQNLGKFSFLVPLGVPQPYVSLVST